MLKKERIIELDILKSLAIILVVACHMDNYLDNCNIISLLDSYFALSGLSLFFFVSGFSLYNRNVILNSNKNILLFYKKRAIRIYPLYWLSLIVDVVVFQIFAVDPGNTNPYNINLINFLVHVFGFQVFFPSFTIQSMWFVGMILLCYLLYPLIIYNSSTWKRTLVNSLLILFALALIKLLVNVISINFFVYCSIFISGILMRQIDFFSNYYKNKYIPFFVISLLLVSLFLLLADTNVMKFKNNNLISFALMNLYLFVFSVVSFSIVKLLLPFVSDQFISIFSSISYSSYAIYLFQSPILSIFKIVAKTINLNMFAADMLMLIVGLPILFINGYFIQSLFSKLTK